MPSGVYKHPPQCGFQKEHPSYLTKAIIKKISKSNKGKLAGYKHPRWKGGKYKNDAGYIMIYNPQHPFCNKDRCVREHRLIIEQYLKRYLTPIEQVHHLGERDDNRLHMLMAFNSNSAHKRFHKNTNNVKSEEIIFDGRKIH